MSGTLGRTLWRAPLEDGGNAQRILSRPSGKNFISRYGRRSRLPRGGTPHASGDESGNFLICSMCDEQLEFRNRCDDESPGQQEAWIFSSCGRYTGLMTKLEVLVASGKASSPCEVARGPSPALSRPVPAIKRKAAVPLHLWSLPGSSHKISNETPPSPDHPAQQQFSVAWIGSVAFREAQGCPASWEQTSASDDKRNKLKYLGDSLAWHANNMISQKPSRWDRDAQIFPTKQRRIHLAASEARRAH